MHIINNRGLKSAVRKIQMAFAFIRSGHKDIILPFLGVFFYFGAAGIRQTQYSGHFVERFAGGIVGCFPKAWVSKYPFTFNISVCPPLAKRHKKEISIYRCQ